MSIERTNKMTSRKRESKISQYQKGSKRKQEQENSNRRRRIDLWMLIKCFGTFPIQIWMVLYVLNTDGLRPSIKQSTSQRSAEVIDSRIYRHSGIEDVGVEQVSCTTIVPITSETFPRCDFFRSWVPCAAINVWYLGYALSRVFYAVVLPPRHGLVKLYFYVFSLLRNGR